MGVAREARHPPTSPPPSAPFTICQGLRTKHCKEKGMFFSPPAPPLCCYLGQSVTASKPVKALQSRHTWGQTDRNTVLHCITMQCTTQHCSAEHCTTLNLTEHQSTALKILVFEKTSWFNLKTLASILKLSPPQ